MSTLASLPSDTESDDRVTRAARDDPVVALSSEIQRLHRVDTGAAARLRRTDPSLDPIPSVYDVEGLLLHAGVRPDTERAHARWSRLIHALALARGRHSSAANADPGIVLHRLRFSEARLRQLLEADEHVLADLMPRVARRLGQDGAAVDWRVFAQLMLDPDGPGGRQARRRLARGFLQAHSRDTTNDVPVVGEGATMREQTERSTTTDEGAS